MSTLELRRLRRDPLDTGLPGPLRLSVNEVTVINAARQMVFVLESRGTPAPIRLIVRGNVAGNTIDIPLPSIPGMDGPAPTFEVLTFWRRPTVVDRRAVSYLTTPPTCPVSGRWTNRFTFTYWDGVVQTFTTTSPCGWRAAHARRPLRVEGRDEDGAEQQATSTTGRESSR